MNYPLSIAVVGTGAVGGYYGALLQRAGHDVHFLLHRDYQHVRQSGLTIESVNGNFKLPRVNAYADPGDMPPCDWVVVALKTTANDVLPGILPAILKKSGMVLTLQNGLGSEELIADIVGADRVMGGLCFLCSNKVAPGHIHHLDYGLITLGEYTADQRPAGITSRLERVGKVLADSGIPAKLADDLAGARWKKLVWNIPFNGMSVITNRLTDQLICSPQTRDRCISMMHEVAEAATACARPIGDSFIKKMISDTEKMSPYSPSMKLDYDRGNPMEIESIYGNPIRAARARGVQMKETEKLYEQLKATHLVV